ncbi:MAG: helix-turn-helix transcriptional regulator [Verrucomicrobiales bacterium]|nr:helix-turn-helix transcriptional regulator [Verrucomicrobiales bacterium]
MKRTTETRGKGVPSPLLSPPPLPTLSDDKVATSFTETSAWKSVGKGWHPLFGNFAKLGFCFEWHDFTSDESLDWGRSFHPGGIEVCLNLEGTGTIKGPEDLVVLRPRTSAFYHQGAPPLVAARSPGVRHRFATVEFSVEFLRDLFHGKTDHLHPLVRRFVANEDSGSQASPAEPAGAALLQLTETLRHCPVFKPAQEMWFHSKALEVASRFFFRPSDGDLFCSRTQRLGRERVDRVRTILLDRMAEAPTLEELGRLVGCSPFHLSRLFSENTGTTIQQYLRQIRLERAGELLKTGRCNVTEAAVEVGYTSLSHFSTAFREMFGCCPGLYPLKTATQAQLGGPGNAPGTEDNLARSRGRGSGSDRT